MKNEADIKSVYLMSSEFGLRSERGPNFQAPSTFLVEITNWGGSWLQQLKMVSIYQIQINWGSGGNSWVGKGDGGWVKNLKFGTQ